MVLPIPAWKMHFGPLNRRFLTRGRFDIYQISESKKAAGSTGGRRVKALSNVRGIEMAEEDTSDYRIAYVGFTGSINEAGKGAPAPIGRRVTMARLIDTFENFTRSSDRYAKKLIILTWSLIVLTLLLIVISVMTVIDSRNSASLQNNIALNSQLYSGSNLTVMEAIEIKNPILKDHGGTMSAFQLDTYLGTFEVIYSAYDRHLLSEDDLCVSFSHYVTVTMKYPEISTYLTDMRKSDSGFFQGFVNLVRVITDSKDPSCAAEPVTKTAPVPRVIEEASTRRLRA